MGNEKVYVKIRFGHRSFSSSEVAIIAINRSESCSEYIDTCFTLAEQKLAKHFGFKEDEIAVFEHAFLGSHVTFID